MGLRDRIKRALPIVGMGGNRNPAPSPYTPPPYVPPAPPADPKGGLPPEQFVDQLVKQNPIVIFMKGSPDDPMCGFSANASSILRSYGKPLAHFDVLSDPEVRQAVKDYSQWPTLPQIYVGGEFLGGADIIREMHQNGELKQAIDAATSA